MTGTACHFNRLFGAFPASGDDFMLGTREGGAPLDSTPEPIAWRIVRGDVFVVVTLGAALLS